MASEANKNQKGKHSAFEVSLNIIRMIEIARDPVHSKSSNGKLRGFHVLKVYCMKRVIQIKGMVL